MRSSGNSRSSLMAAIAIAMIGAGMAGAALPRPRKGGSEHRPRRVAVNRPDSALAREIAEHNEAVERRKAEKLAAKRARRIGRA